MNFYLERDAFDALFENAPEKLNVVKKVIVNRMKKVKKFFLPSLTVVIAFYLVFTEFCKSTS